MRSQNAFWGSLVAAATLLLVVAIVVLKPSPVQFLGWVGAGTSTFFGAVLAFYFNSRRASNDREERECVAGNLTLMALAALRNWLVLYQRNHIEAVRDTRDRWFTMRPGDLISARLDIDKASLSFLLPKHESTWRSVVLEETRFLLLERAIEERNNLVTETMWPKLEAEGIGHGVSVETARVEAILGPATTQSLKNVTTFIIDACGQDIQSLTECIGDLRQAFAKTHPEREFVDPLSSQKPSERPAHS